MSNKNLLCSNFDTVYVERSVFGALDTSSCEYTLYVLNENGEKVVLGRETLALTGTVLDSFCSFISKVATYFSGMPKTVENIINCFEIEGTVETSKSYKQIFKLKLKNKCCREEFVLLGLFTIFQDGNSKKYFFNLLDTRIDDYLRNTGNCE